MVSRFRVRCPIDPELGFKVLGLGCRGFQAAPTRLPRHPGWDGFSTFLMLLGITGDV